MTLITVSTPSCTDWCLEIWTLLMIQHFSLYLDYKCVCNSLCCWNRYSIVSLACFSTDGLIFVLLEAHFHFIHMYSVLSDKSNAARATWNMVVETPVCSSANETGTDRAEGLGGCCRLTGNIDHRPPSTQWWHWRNHSVSSGNTVRLSERVCVLLQYMLGVRETLSCS